MTEKEKMDKGMLYNPNKDKELLTYLKKCKQLCYKFNKISPLKINSQKKLIKKIIGKTKSNFYISSPFFCDYGFNIEIGENFFSNYNCVILDAAKVTFGDNVLIAPNCGFYTSGHPINIEERISGSEFAYPIHIGNNVWIGANVKVLPGVTIGDNSIIGAGSVVNKNIPSNVIASGNPCKVIREITRDNTRNEN